MIDTVRDFFHDSCANDDFNVLVRRKGEQREQDLDLKTEASSLLGSKSTYERSLPAIIHPFRLENFGISVSYFNTGICVFLLPTPVTYYLIDTVGVSSGQLSAFLTLVYLPWSMKFLFGILTDSIVILGSRRKSWMLIGWSIFIFLNIVLFFIDEPGLVLITSLMFLSTSAYLLSDVCNDAQSIERSKFECLDVKGSYQTTIYIIRAFGMIISSIQAALLYNTTSWGWGLSLSQLFLMSALIPLTTVMPFSYFIVELKSGKLKVDDIKYTDVPSVSESWQRIWDLLQLRAIWYPLIFFVPYNCFLLSNGAWSNYLVLSLEFTDFALGVITISGAATYFLGMMFFQRVVFRRDWREIMIWCTVLYSLASLAQILLFWQVNQSMGIGNLAFASLIVALQYFFYGIGTMPLTVICVMVCPENSEGVAYAVLTTVANLCSTVASNISTLLTYAFPVSNSALSSGEYAGITYLVIFVSMVQLMPLVLLPFCPKTREDQQALIDKEEKSEVGGAILVGFVSLSLVITLILNFSLIS